MIKFETLDLSIVSLIILLLIYFNVYNRSEKSFLPSKLFLALVQANMLLIIVDIFGWAFNGAPGDVFLFLNNGSNLLLYILAPLAPSLWLLYSDYQVFSDENRIIKTKRILVVLFLLNATAAVISLFTGWYFYIDSQNIYHRGDLLFIHAAFNYAIIIYSFFLILLNKRKIEKEYYYFLLFFYLPPSIGTFLQMINYGTSYNWIGMMLSILIIYFYIQNRGLNTDYLTGVYNRRQFDRFLNAKISYNPKQNAFSAILIDLDNFKQINDKFGHDAGDEALKQATAIIRKTLRQDDFIARVGGDEFIAVLDISDRKMLEQTVKRIRKCADAFNHSNEKPYKLSFSMGYSVYKTDSNMNPDEFIKYLDSLMYEDKKNKN